MNLGEFRELTKELTDDVDIVLEESNGEWATACIVNSEIIQVPKDEGGQETLILLAPCTCDDDDFDETEYNGGIKSINPELN